MTPYYDRDGITIYCGNCHNLILDNIGFTLTDPPYPDYLTDEYQYSPDGLEFLKNYKCRQLIFWTAKEEFQLDYTAIHIWDKKTGVGSEYERIFERNGQANYKVFRYYLINSTVAASYTGDVFTGHKSQKPIALITDLMGMAGRDNIIYDPFLGSGTTLVAAQRLGYRAIGCEIKEEYCKIAVERLRQPTFFSLPQMREEAKPEQLPLIE